MNTMAEMMLPYQNLLRTSDQILSDEFGLEQDINSFVSQIGYGLLATVHLKHSSPIMHKIIM